MRWSQTYIPTLREDPAAAADAEAASHRLLVRAAFIRQLMAGHCTLLPLAVRVRAKIIHVIREEMTRIGAQEFLLPAMHPAEIWERTGRWEWSSSLSYIFRMSRCLPLREHRQRTSIATWSPSLPGAHRYLEPTGAFPSGRPDRRAMLAAIDAGLLRHALVSPGEDALRHPAKEATGRCNHHRRCHRRPWPRRPSATSTRYPAG